MPVLEGIGGSTNGLVLAEGSSSTATLGGGQVEVEVVAVEETEAAEIIEFSGGRISAVASEASTERKKKRVEVQRIQSVNIDASLARREKNKLTRKHLLRM